MEVHHHSHTARKKWALYEQCGHKGKPFEPFDRRLIAIINFIEVLAFKYDIVNRIFTASIYQRCN